MRGRKMGYGNDRRGDHGGSDRRGSNRRGGDGNRGGGYGGGNRGGGFRGRSFDRGPREMHKATCAECGAECEVPFKPTGERPVYCKECFQKHKPQRF